MLRYLYGTDERLKHPAIRAESERRFGDALQNIDAMNASTQKLKDIGAEVVPAKSLHEAFEQFADRRG